MVELRNAVTNGVEKDHAIEVTAEGEDERDAITELERLIRSDFTEQE